MSRHLFNVFIPLAAIAMVASAGVLNRVAADVIFFENWLDDTIGSAPNATPDIGLAANYGSGTFLLLDAGGGEKTLRATGSPGNELIVQYHPLSAGSNTLIEAQYLFAINSGSTLAFNNAVIQSFVFDSSVTVLLYWGEDLKLRVLDDNFLQVSDSFNFSLDQELDVTFLADLANDTFSLSVNGTSVLTDTAIGASVVSAPRLDLLSNIATTATVELQHYYMNATSVPEPGLMGICSLGFFGLVAVRRKRSSQGR